MRSWWRSGLIVVLAACGEVHPSFEDASPGGDDAAATDAAVAIDAAPACAAGEVSCDGNAPRVCTAAGVWETAAACVDQTCVAGACQGVCAPGQRTCTATTSSVCDAAGAWTVTDLRVPRATRTVGGALDETLVYRGGFAAHPDGGYVLAGTRGPAGQGDFHVVRLAADGALRWERTYGTGDDGATSVLPVPGGVIACGNLGPGSLGCTAGRVCSTCTRLDDSGAVVWQRVWPGANRDVNVGVAVAATDTGFLLDGTTTDSDAWLVVAATTFDLAGAAGTTRTFSRDGEDAAFDLRRAPDGTYLLAGYTNAWRSCQQPWLMRFDAAGTLRSSYPAGPCTVESAGAMGDQRGYGAAVLPLADGSAIMVGRQWDGANRSQGFIAKVAPLDVPVQSWRRLHGGAGDEVINAVELLPDGGFLLAGTSTTGSAGGNDLWLVRTDATGNALWSRTYGGAGDDTGVSIARSPDGTYLIAGSTASTGAGGKDYWLLDVPVVCE